MRAVKHWSSLLGDVAESPVFQLLKMFPKYHPKPPHLTSKLVLHWARGWTRLSQELPSNPNYFTILWHYIKWRIYLNFKHKTNEVLFIYTVRTTMLLGQRDLLVSACASPQVLEDLEHFCSSQTLRSSLANVQKHSHSWQSTSDLHFQCVEYTKSPSI